MSSAAERSRGTVAFLMGAHVVARFPAGMTALALLIAAQRALGSFTEAGLVVAAWSIGAAVAGPIAARGLGTWGVRPTVLTTASVGSAAMLALALLPATTGSFLALALLAGLSTPPVSAAARSAYPRIAPPERIATVYSVDVTLQQFSWILGPVVVTAAAATRPGLSLVIIAAVQFVGAVVFAAVPASRGRAYEAPTTTVPTTTVPLSTVPTSTVPISTVPISTVPVMTAPTPTAETADPPRSRAARRRRARPRGGLLRTPALLVCLGLVFTMMASSGAVETGVVAAYGHGSGETGLLLALWSVGSLAGGILFARVQIGPSSLARRSAIGALGLIPLAVTIALPVALAGLFVSGVGSAPMFAAMYVVLARSLPEHRLAEAYGWVSSAQLVGTASGTALAGLVADLAGGSGTMILAAALGVAGALIPVAFARATRP